MKKPEVSIVGTGNVAFHLGRALQQGGISVREVYGRNQDRAEALSEKLEAERCEDLRHLKPVDLVFLCVSDEAVSVVSALLPDGLFQAHTSGSIELEALESEKRAVFYPLQTFSKNRALDFSNIPLCLETSSPDESKILTALAEILGGPVHWLNSDERAKLHVAAVFASNFPNILYQVASELLEESDLGLDLLRPLLLETARKAADMPPLEAQTGPARRGDMEVLNAHLNQLSAHPELKHLYARLSELIIQRYHGKEL